MSAYLEPPEVSTNGYHDLPVPDLRRLVRERGLANGTAVAVARREQLLALLDGKATDIVPVAQVARDLTRGVNAADSSIGNMLAALARDAVDAEISARADDLRPTVNIQLGESRQITLPPDAHGKLADALALAHAGLPIMLVGPAGSGKNHLSMQIAQAFQRVFTFNSLSAGVTESHILGRVLPDATGNWRYHDSPFVQSYRTGGVHLFDEIDAADANLLVILNAALANGHLSIPFAQTEPIARHNEFVFVAAANTFGRGADRQYVGRNALDAATLDRFSVSTIYVDYDRALERRLAESLCPDHASGLLTWTWGTRERIDRNKLRRIMSTRTVKNAAHLLAIGRSLESVRESYFAGWSDDERAKVTV